MGKNLIQHTTEYAMHIVRAYVKPGDIVIDATCGNGHDTLQLARMLELPAAASDVALPDSSKPAGSATDLSEEGAKAGQLFAFDLQQEAIAATRNLLTQEGYRVTTIHQPTDAHCASPIVLVCLGHENMREYFIAHPICAAPSCEGNCPAPSREMDHDARACTEGFANTIVFNLGYLPGGDKTVTTCIETTMAAVQDALHLLKPDGLLCITMYSGHPEGAEEKRALLAFAEELDSKRWHTSYISMPNQKHDPPEILLITRKR